MGPTLAIIAKDLWQRVRDRSAVLNGVVAPLLLTLLMSLAFGRSETKFHATFALVDADHGTVATSLVDDVLGGPELSSMVKLRPEADRRSAQRALDDGKVDAAIVIPAGFSTAVTSGRAARLEVLRSGSAPYAGQVAESVAQGFVQQLEASRLAIAAAVAAGATPEHLQKLMAELPSRAPAIALDEAAASRGDQHMATQFAPAMGVFFLYFVAGLGVRGLLAERSAGTFTRLLAAPVSGRAVLGGKVFATFLLGLSSLITLMLATSLLLSADWGPLPAAGLVILAITFAVTAITACMLTFARTERQAGFGMSIITFAMALLGGNFVSLARAPVALRTASLLTPNGWALRAFGDLADGAGIGSITRPVAAIVAFGLTTGSLAVWRADRVLRP